jgi:hypothetical protein
MSLDRPASLDARRWSRELLEQELGRVHAREFARLLCRAAFLRLSARRELAPRLRALGFEDDLACWRRAALCARSLAERDGFELAGLLRHALAHAPEAWASAARLVEAALEIDASEGTRWHAAALDAFEGRPAARARLAEFAGRATNASWRLRARQLLDRSDPPETPAREERSPW